MNNKKKLSAKTRLPSWMAHHIDFTDKTQKNTLPRDISGPATAGHFPPSLETRVKKFNAPFSFKFDCLLKLCLADAIHNFK